MKNIIIILIIIISAGFLFANENPMVLSLNGTGFYNSIRAAAIDVDNPNNQPMIFSVHISKNPGYTIENAYMFFTLKWNGNLIIDQSKSQFKEYALNMLNSNLPVNFTNRDIINENGSIYLAGAQPSISLSDFLNNRHFKSAIMNTGLFPDGTYEFIMEVRNGNTPGAQVLSNMATYIMNIHNINNITLLSPGTMAGQTIPEVSQRPVIFNWSANVNNPANTYIFEVREYTQSNTMNINNLENSGRTFYQQSNLISPLFTQNLPYVEGNYYAWRVSIPLVTDQSEFGMHPVISSQWNIFKYVSAASNIPNPYQALIDQLQSFQNPVINQIINQGYLPTGRFFYNGMNIPASQVQTLIPQILNSNNVVIEIVD